MKLEYSNVAGHGDIAFTWYEGKKPNGEPYLPAFPAEIGPLRGQIPPRTTSRSSVISRIV